MKSVKLLSFSFILTLCFIYTAEAQTTRSGVKGGINFSNLFVDEATKDYTRTGFHIGVYGQFLNVMEEYGVQPELLFNTKGGRADYDLTGNNGELRYNLNYIDVPILAVFKLGDAADLHFGPYVGYLVNASISASGDFGPEYTNLDKGSFNNFDYGLAGDFGLNFGELSVGVRYNLGLRRVADSAEGDMFFGNSKNSVGQIFLAYNMNY